MSGQHGRFRILLHNANVSPASKRKEAGFKPTLKCRRAFEEDVPERVVLRFSKNWFIVRNRKVWYNFCVSLRRLKWLIMKRLIFLLYICLLLLCLNACGDSAVSNAQGGATSLTPSEPVAETEPEVDDYELLLLQFLNDADVPEAARKKFTSAIRGDKAAQEWVHEYALRHDGLAWPVAETVYRYSSENDENVCLFRIAMLYYNGADSIEFLQDKVKAFEWAKVSANKGNADAALCAGDMVRDGDGVPVDEQAAFAFYLTANDIGKDGFTLERLGDCYADGIGTTADRQKAFECYLDCAMMGFPAGIYKLSGFTGYADINPMMTYKAASSQDYSGGYWAMAYDGIDGYAADNFKRDLVNRLLDLWDSGNDLAASNIQKNLKTNEHFSSEFVEALTQAVYTYSYHAFAEEYGLRPNRTYEDTAIIHFATYDSSDPEEDYIERAAEQYLEQDSCEFYEYDFDGDGIDEIGIPMHSGTGGAFMVDGFTIFKKNTDGLYERFSGGPYCSLRDAMRIIQYNGTVYFIVNPFDDTGNAPHNVLARTIGKNGHGHEISIIKKDYSLQHIITYTDKTYSAGYNALFSDVEQQLRDAVSATKLQGVYSPDGEKQLEYNSDEDWWSDTSGVYSGEIVRHDTFFIADIDNSGIEQTIHKGRLITQLKYYNDYNWFQIYESPDFETSPVPIIAPVFIDNYYGRHSGGNIYDFLPVSGAVIQFWTYEYGGVTFCVSLQRYGLLYALQIVEVRNGEVGIVSKSLYFDEAQNVDIMFS